MNEINQLSGNESLISNKYKLYSIYLLLALFLTTIGAFVGKGLVMNEVVLLILFFVSLVAFMFATGKMKKMLFFLFCFIEGVTLAPLITIYAAIDGQAISHAIFSTVIITGVALFVGYRAKNISFMGLGLFASLLGLIILNIVSFFVAIPFLAQIGAIIFSIYIAYDINQYKLMLECSNGNIEDDDVLNQVMNQYLNIVNLFLKILRIFSKD